MPKSFILYLALLILVSCVHLMAYKYKENEICCNLNKRLKHIWIPLLMGGPAMWYPHLFGPLMLTGVLWLAWLEYCQKKGIRNYLKWTGGLILPIQWIVATEFIYNLSYSKLWTLFIPIFTLLMAVIMMKSGYKKIYLKGLLVILILPSLGLSLFERYPGWPLSLALIVIITSQWSDACQYVIGKYFGKNQLNKISPNKTIEGLLGGWMLAGITTIAPIAIWRNEWTQTSLLVVTILIFAYLGGLWSSYEKRKIGIKDWGSFLKSHGGLLDRIDSLLFSLPACYLFIAILKVINMNI